MTGRGAARYDPRFAVLQGVVRGASGVCLAVLGALACAESSALPPTAPTPLPSDKIGELNIACPTEVTVRSRDGVSAPVAYQPPRVSGGQAPVRSDCTPPSGSVQPIGTATLNCTASDRLGQQTACSVPLTVLPPPRLAATKLLAFGDSLTAGVVSGALSRSGQPAGSGPWLPSGPFRPQNVAASYPRLLERMLRRAYPVQSIAVIDSGLPGETAVAAVSRFQRDVVRLAPDLALIMEGSNDVLQSTGATPRELADPAGAALEAMVLEAAGRGVEAVLATIPPIRASVRGELAAEAVVELNRQIRSIAAGRRIPLVDVFAVVSAGGCPAAGTVVATPCLGADGLHLTQRGYELVAEAFFRVIVDHHDVSVAASESAAGGSAPSPAPRPAAAGRRGR